MAEVTRAEVTPEHLRIAADMLYRVSMPYPTLVRVVGIAIADAEARGRASAPTVASAELGAQLTSVCGGKYAPGAHTNHAMGCGAPIWMGLGMGADGTTPIRGHLCSDCEQPFCSRCIGEKGHTNRWDPGCRMGSREELAGDLKNLELAAMSWAGESEGELRKEFAACISRIAAALGVKL